VEQFRWIKARISPPTGTKPDLLAAVTRLLVEGKVVGWFYGLMEFDRALGCDIWEIHVTLTCRVR
jgi:hypothetical protein